MTTLINPLKQHFQKAKTILETRRRRPGVLGHSLAHWIENYTRLSNVFELTSLSQAHLIGLYSATENLCNASSQLGIFSEEFEKVTGFIAGNMSSKLFKEAPDAGKELMKRWLQLAFIGSATITRWAQDTVIPKQKETEFDAPFRDELFVRWMLTTGYIDIVLNNMAEAANIEKNLKKHFVATFHLVILSTLFASYPTTELYFSENLFLYLAPFIESDLKTFTNVEDTRIKAYFAELTIALQNKDLKKTEEIWKEVMDTFSYPHSAFLKDIQAAHDLSLRLKNAYQSGTENKQTLLNLVG